MLQKIIIKVTLLIMVLGREHGADCIVRFHKRRGKVASRLCDGLLEALGLQDGLQLRVGGPAFSHERLLRLGDRLSTVPAFGDGGKRLGTLPAAPSHHVIQGGPHSFVALLRREAVGRYHVINMTDHALSPRFQFGESRPFDGLNNMNKLVVCNKNIINYYKYIIFYDVCVCCIIFLPHESSRIHLSARATDQCGARFSSPCTV